VAKFSLLQSWYIFPKIIPILWEIKEFTSYTVSVLGNEDKQRNASCSINEKLLSLFTPIQERF